MSPNPATQDPGDIRYPSAPAGLTVYVVGDIHGCLDLLLKVQRSIDEDKARSSPERTAEIYLGDYIDRGPDPAGVVSRLIARSLETNAVFLRGNHEQMLLDFLDGAECLEEWRSLGGTSTLLSYGMPSEMLARAIAMNDVRRQFADKLPPDHRSFYEQTGSYVQVGSYLAVHAGVRPGVSLENQKTVDLLSIRQEFLRSDNDFGFVVVHGHTPIAEPEMRRNRINLDTGAFVTHRLACLKIDKSGAHLLGS